MWRVHERSDEGFSVDSQGQPSALYALGRMKEWPKMQPSSGSATSTDRLQSEAHLKYHNSGRRP